MGIGWLSLCSLRCKARWRLTLPIFVHGQCECVSVCTHCLVELHAASWTSWCQELSLGGYQQCILPPFERLDRSRKFDPATWKPLDLVWWYRSYCCVLKLFFGLFLMIVSC